MVVICDTGSILVVSFHVFGRLDRIGAEGAGSRAA